MRASRAQKDRKWRDRKWTVLASRRGNGQQELVLLNVPLPAGLSMQEGEENLSFCQENSSLEII